MGGGLTLSIITANQVPGWFGSMLVCVVIMLYVSYGGLRGTAWVNTFQTIVFMILGVVTFVVIINKFGGISSAMSLVAEKHPELIENIYNDGHEVALHGWKHLILNKLNPKIFEKEIIKTIKTIMHITKETPRGFRAPRFSLNRKTNWVLNVLIRHKLKYDSSIFPCNTFLYGIRNAPYYPYYPSLRNPEQIDVDQRRIIELPLLINKISFLRIPAAGGFGCDSLDQNSFYRRLER